MEPAAIVRSRVLGKGFRPTTEYEVKTYDFYRPDKVSRDQIRSLGFIHETFARQASTLLSGQLFSTAQLRLALVDQMTYEEFIRSLPSPTVLAAVTMKPLRGAAVLEIDPALTYAILDRLFGGAGSAAGLTREITDLECSVLTEALAPVVQCLRSAWSSVADLEPQLADIETNPAFCQVVPPKDMVVLAGMKAQIGTEEGFINLCLPAHNRGAAHPKALSHLHLQQPANGAGSRLQPAHRSSGWCRSRV